MQKKLLFIYNPTAGHGNVSQKLEDFVDVFTANGYDTIVHPTRRAGDIADTIPEYGNIPDIVVVAGGDGSIGEAFSALAKMQDPPPLGIIPSGSTNDFANSLMIPKNIIDAAIDIVSGEEMLIDAGTFNGKIYTYIAGFGLFTNIAYSTEQAAKNFFGYFAYLWQAGKELFNVPVFKIRYTVNGRSEEGEFIYGMVTNSISVAGVKNLTGRDVLLDDGLFEVNLIRNLKNPLELGEVMVCLLSGEQTPYIVREKTDSIVIESDEPLQWTLDGEDGGSSSRGEIKILKQSVKIIVPDKFAHPEKRLPEKEDSKTEEDEYDEYN